MVEASGASRIVVAEMGNKRTNITEQDTVQCIKDLAGWLETNAASHYTAQMVPKANGAAAEQVTGVLTEFGAQASHLAFSLQKYNGGLQYLDTFVGLTIDEINGLGSTHGLKARHIVPFAKDIDESLQCVQINDDGSETVISFDTSDGSVMENLNMTYSQYIEDIRTKLLTNKLVFEEGLGLVSVA